ncbi:MAG: transglycosylase [Syntrophus sp. (in: bacteria)]|nr:transglycosylase [Syntrophus sp. (in: bacteria)]
MTGGRGDALPQGVPMKRWRLLILICMLLLTVSCAAWMDRQEPPRKPPRPTADVRFPAMETADTAGGIDDLDIPSLETAIDRSLRYYENTKESSFRFHDRVISVSELKSTLIDFRAIIRSADPGEIKISRIKESFEFISLPGQDVQRAVIFTGYYVPTLEGARVKTERYRYPIYGKPDDLTVVNLGKFNAKYKGEQLIGRIERGELLPYHSRDEIDRKGALKGRNLEFLWVDDPVALYFLHIQGSGKIRMPDGQMIVISYAQSNGHPFRPLSRTLIEKEKLTTAEISYAGIMDYLKRNPSEIEDLFSCNDRYIFFRRVERDPLGSLQFPVTSGRTIATDPDVFPKGSLALIRTQKPLFDANGQIRQWVPISRFVLNQDAGAAIKGPGRVDIFCGDGPNAEQLAGSLKEKGDIYIMLRKN